MFRSFILATILMAGGVLTHETQASQTATLETLKGE